MKLKNLLNEKLFLKNQEYDFYINPSSTELRHIYKALFKQYSYLGDPKDIQEFIRVRGIGTPSGDLYIITDPNLTHYKFIKLLQAKNYLSKDFSIIAQDWHSDFTDDFVTFMQEPGHENTSTFKIGHSYKNLKGVDDIFNKVVGKNPDLIFIKELGEY